MLFVLSCIAIAIELKEGLLVAVKLSKVYPARGARGRPRRLQCRRRLYP